MANSAKSTAEKKKIFKRAYALGKSKKDAAAMAGVSINTPANWYKSDPDFAVWLDREEASQAIVSSKDRIDILVQRQEDEQQRAKAEKVPDFPEFVETYVGHKLWPHQLNMYDVLRGREPRWLHPAMTYVKGDLDRVVLNVPPNHAKSATATEDYALWRMMENPDIKIAVISKSKDQAKKFMKTMNNRLTHPDFEKLQNAFAPAGGWKTKQSSWTSEYLYLSNASTENRDPTLQVKGIGAQLYGSRLDLIILDDVEDTASAKQWEDHLNWINTEVFSRLPPSGGQLVIVGTRLANKDLYSEAINPEHYGGEESPYTLLSMPTVLEDSDDPEKMLTLWPKSDKPRMPHEKPNADGSYDAWTPTWAIKQRNNMSAAQWQRMYQQKTSSEDTVFSEAAIRQCIDGRGPGLIPVNSIAGRVNGMDGLHIIAGIDPAASNFTAFTCYGIDFKTGERFIIDLHNEKTMSLSKIHQKIYEWTDKYGVREWLIEDNAAQTFLVQDDGLRSNLATKGSKLSGFKTLGYNKNDQELGVAGMASLFETQKIHLPSPKESVHVKSLIEQLVVWDPTVSQKIQKTDQVMSLWFCENRALQLIKQRRNTQTASFMSHPLFTSQRSPQMAGRF